MILNFKMRLFIESYEVSNDTVMVRPQKGTYSRDFLWRVEFTAIGKGHYHYQYHYYHYRRRRQRYFYY